MSEVQRKVSHLDERQEVLISCLEDALVRARKGELRSMVFVGTMNNGQYLQGFLGAWQEARYGLIGAIESVKGQILSDLTLNDGGK